MKKFLPKTLNNPQGFTLVELLVVVAIIAVLSVIGIAVFTGVQKNARDGRRRADIQAISQAVESHFVQGTGYTVPLSATWFAGNVIPSDPSAGASYIWATALTTAGFRVCADLSSSGSTEGLTEQDYCLSNQQ